MALHLQNLPGFSAGMRQEEQGINVREFKTVVEPEFRNIVPKKDGTARGFVSAPMKKTVTISGEVSSVGAFVGVMAASAVAAFAPANTSSYFGAPTTSLFLTRGEVTEARDNGALLDMNAEFEAYAGIP